MILNRTRLAIATLALAGVPWCVAAAPQAAGTQADNTKVNKKDRSPDAMTADQQKNNSSDTELTKQIRKSLTSDKSLSTYAHNVKVITQNGAVTLKGPVRTEEEKAAIEAKATEIAGTGKVTSELTVAPPKTK
jgi:hyperosmotically inducible protein